MLVHAYAFAFQPSQTVRITCAIGQFRFAPPSWPPRPASRFLESRDPATVRLQHMAFTIPNLTIVTTLLEFVMSATGFGVLLVYQEHRRERQGRITS